jgi:hypothetical protein
MLSRRKLARWHYNSLPPLITLLTLSLQLKQRTSLVIEIYSKPALATFTQLTYHYFLVRTGPLVVLRELLLAVTSRYLIATDWMPWVAKARSSRWKGSKNRSWILDCLVMRARWFLAGKSLARSPCIKYCPFWINKQLYGNQMPISITGNHNKSNTKW